MILTEQETMLLNDLKQQHAEMIYRYKTANQMA